MLFNGFRGTSGDVFNGFYGVFEWFYRIWFCKLLVIKGFSLAERI